MMASRTDTIRDHQERLNRVLDHIRRHLDEPLTLDRLANVACFSPYHFHRIFAAHVGETLREHVRRLRLELAAHRLTHTSRTVTDIALSAGYETPSAFTRAFSQHFDMSPTAFQAERRAVFLSAPLSLTLGLNQMEEAVNPEIKEREETKVVYVRRIGAYNESAEQAWGAVCAFAGPKGLIGPASEFIGISHDDPNVTPAEKLRYDACIGITTDVQPEGELGVQTIDGGRFAVFLHEGPYTGLGETYGKIYAQWLPGSSEELRDAACFEKYLNTPDNTKPEDLRTEIWIPIR